MGYLECPEKIPFHGYPLHLTRWTALQIWGRFGLEALLLATSKLLVCFEAALSSRSNCFRERTLTIGTEQNTATTCELYRPHRKRSEVGRRLCCRFTPPTLDGRAKGIHLNLYFRNTRHVQREVAPSCCRGYSSLLLRARRHKPRGWGKPRSLSRTRETGPLPRHRQRMSTGSL